MKIRIDEPSFIIGLCSITPRIDYSQGNRFYNRFKTLDDLHKPALDGIGFQDLTENKMHWASINLDANGNEGNFAIGKQPAWIDYKTNFNRAHGNFASGQSEAFMVLNRGYNVNKTVNGITSGISDASTYIDPTKYNYIFADVSLNSMNYWVQMKIEDKTRRLISASNIPNL